MDFSKTEDFVHHHRRSLTQIITIGKRLVPAEQIAFVEPFDPANNPAFKPDRDFKGRVVLLNRDTVLTEMTPQDFAAAHHMRMLADDNIAIGQSIAFRVETFAPTEAFQPSKPYLTRLKWRDQDGNEQSKLLVTRPETVLGELSLRQMESVPPSTASPKRQQRRSGIVEDGCYERLAAVRLSAMLT